MAIPNTPLIANLVAQIDREIKGFLKGENCEYMMATPQNLAMLNQKLAEHFHSSGITASYTTPVHYGDSVSLNVSVSDGYLLSRLREINVVEYSKIITWMTMNGQDVPKLESLTPETSTESPTPTSSGIQSFTGSEREKVETMASKILAAEQERRQWQERLLAPSADSDIKRTTDDGVVSIGFDALPTQSISDTSIKDKEANADWLKVY